jgi:DnaJ-class molecular chaperone
MKAPILLEVNPSMNAQDSRLTCEHCHGTGYITTALGKRPCLTCSASEVSTGQESSEVSNHQEMSGEQG